MKFSFRTNAKPRQIINSRKIFYAFGISIILIFPSSCVTQQSDLARIQKNLELQIVQIKEEKITLGLQVEEIRGQLIRVNEEAQKTRSNLASINQKAILLQEKDFASLYGKFEETEKSINDLRKAFTNETSLLKSKVESIQANIQTDGKELQTEKIHDTPLNPKVDSLVQQSDAQVTKTHLQEVNGEMESVTQSLENLSLELNTRIDDQEQRLNKAMTSFQRVQGAADFSKTNLSHLNQLTESVNQLRDVINTIGIKLGERVDQHEDRLGEIAKRVNRLQSSKQQLQPNTSIPFAPQRKPSQFAGNSGGQGCYQAAISKPQPFLGNGGEIIILDDGTTWKELSYQYLYLYEYYPSVIVCPSTGKMFLDEHEFEIVPAN